MIKENKNKCSICKECNAIVTTNKLLWCANCYTNYLKRTLNRRRIKYV
mgnify:FL=1